MSKSDAKIKCSGDQTQSKSVYTNPNMLKIFQTKVRQTPSNDNVEKLKMMVEYIEQDGCEKANEIDIKSDEECRITVSCVKANIDKEFEEMKRKILQQDALVYSKLNNESRLYFLNCRKQIVDQLLAKVKRRFNATLENSRTRRTVLVALIIQAAVKFCEPTVILRVQEADLRLAEKLLPHVRENYVRLTGLPIKFILDELHPLPLETGGGVQLRTLDDRMYVNNIVSRRVELIMDSILPVIRMDLFGYEIRSTESDQQSISDYHSAFNSCG